MRKPAFIIILLLSLSSSLAAQKLSNEQANKIVEQCYQTIASNDSLAFYSLWDLSFQNWPFHSRPFAKKDLEANFIALREFLDEKNISIKKRETELSPPDKNEPGFESGYLITAWFVIGNKSRKAIGLRVINSNGAWKIINSPDFTVESKGF